MVVPGLGGEVGIEQDAHVICFQKKGGMAEPGVDFIDSAGLALLVEARKKLAPEGRVLNVLLTPSRQPERVLKLGRFDTIMNLAYSLNDL